MSWHNVQRSDSEMGTLERLRPCSGMRPGLPFVTAVHLSPPPRPSLSHTNDSTGLTPSSIPTRIPTFVVGHIGYSNHTSNPSGFSIPCALSYFGYSLSPFSCTLFFLIRFNALPGLRCKVCTDPYPDHSSPSCSPRSHSRS